jgi:hypothetical protein
MVIAHDSGITLKWFTDNHPTQSEAFDFCTGSRVLDVAFPYIKEPSQAIPGSYPALFKKNIILAAACSDYTVKILTLPLDPPKVHADGNPPDLGSVLATASHHHIPTSISMTWTSSTLKQNLGGERGRPSGFQLLVVSCHREGVGMLLVSRLSLDDDNKQAEPRSGQLSPFQTVHLPASPSKVSFSTATYPSARHSQILVTCESGTVYVYDPLIRRVPGKGLVSFSDNSSIPRIGSWLASYATRFIDPSTSPDIPSSLAQRKRILDTHWAMDATVIVAVLADGEWGVWHVSGTHPSSPKDPSGFALWGMIGSSIPYHLDQRPSQNPKGPGTSLATMTPHTRRAKADTLFRGAVDSRSISRRAGISVISVPLPSEANNEDLVAMWYDDSVCYLDSLHAYWSRAARRSTDSNLETVGGSLFGPGLTRVEGTNFHGQAIVSIAEIPQMQSPKPERVLVIATEHGLIYKRSGSQAVIPPARKLLTGRRPRVVSRAGPSRSPVPAKALEFGASNAAMDSMADDDDDVFMSGALPVP